jgi:hypothetical protein
MRSSQPVRILAIAVALLLWLSSAASAQWLHYPTPGTPKKATDPAPRTADHKPDLSGLWANDKRACPPGGCVDMEISEQFMDIGYGVKGGLPLQPWARDLVKQRTLENGKDDPTSRCLPGTPIQMHTSPFMRKLIQTPGLLILLNENSSIFRQIFTDDRPLPTDPWPYYFGYSSGKWEGDTLVVHTNGFRDGSWLDRNGTPLTDAAKMTERFRRPNYGTLEIEITVDDPKAYTAPWTIVVKQHLALNTEMLPSTCLENEKDLSHMVGK